jgi:histidinol phosphatase-like PHP family hydrolase
MAQTECAIFEEDEVCKRINDRIIYGIVTESSEFLSSDEEEDDEDVLSRGTVRILWHPNGSQIRCFSYGERSDVPRLQQVEQKSRTTLDISTCDRKSVS